MTKSAKKHGLMVIISGPSGVGKSTVVASLMKNNPKLIMSVSNSTRPPRSGEVEGVDYFFISRAEFQKKIEDGEFLEWADVHGELYGTPKAFVEGQLAKGKIVVLEVDTQGAASIKSLVEKGELKGWATVFIFLIPPSIDILAFRLKRRKTETEELVNSRLKAAISELQVMEKYDYIVVNDRVETAAKKIIAIINVERERMLLN